jgi:hypothetical protein
MKFNSITMTKYLFLRPSFFVLLILYACGGGDKQKGPANTYSLGSNFSYELTENGCTAKGQAASQEELCELLENQEYNNDCSLDLRQSYFKAQCQGTFEPTRIRPLFLGGYDSYIQANCPSPKTETRYATLKSYCDFLKDESQHEGCFWSQREKEYSKFKCSGVFSSQPKPNSTNTPNPSPAPTPAPTPAPNLSTENALTNELKKACSLEFQIKNSFLPVFPGERTFAENLKIFWKTLETQKEWILSQCKNTVVENSKLSRLKIVSLTDYSKYDPYLGVLSVDVAFNEDHLATYFKLIDRRNAVEKKTQIRFDLGIDAYINDFSDYSSLISDLEMLTPLYLSKIENSVSEVKLGSYTNYDIATKTLQVKEGFFAKSIVSWAENFGVYDKLFLALKQSQIDLKGQLDISTELNTLIDVLRSIEAQQKTLKTLGLGKIIKTLSFSKGTETPMYIDGEFYLSTFGMQVESNGKTLEALQNVFAIGALYDIKVSISSLELPNNFIVFSDWLKNQSVVLEKKKALIEEIRVSDNSGVYGKALYFGLNDTPMSWEKTLGQLK